MKRIGITDYTPIELQPTPYDSHARPEIVYNRADGTRKVCLSGLVFSTLVGLGFILLGCFARGRTKTFHLNSVALELIPLAINVVVLIVTESLGYIHATSLRWALFYEGKLDFNTNLRLLTFSRQNHANGWIANLSFFVTLALCYGSSPLILVRNTYEFYLTDGGADWEQTSHLISISKVTPITLGTAILIQVSLATWCLQSSRIPTWSSHPLTTLVAATQIGGLVRRKGRSMMSAHMRSLPPAPTAPVPRQKSPYAVSPRIFAVLLAITVVLCTLAVWVGIIIHVGHDNFPDGSWNFIPTSAVDPTTNGAAQTPDMTQTVFLKFFTKTVSPYNPNYVPESYMLGILVFCVVIQSILTIGLHCAELQVILLRDEAVWRSLASPGGSKPATTYNSVVQPLQSVTNVMLLVFKPVVHWFFGSALQVDYAKGVLMRVPHVTYLMVLWFVFLAFVIAISFTRPKGPLPATYGHLQTMADIVDELGDVMFWGDKGEADAAILLGSSDQNLGYSTQTQNQTKTQTQTQTHSLDVRHAGTSTMPLPPVHMGVLYI